MNYISIELLKNGVLREEIIKHVSFIYVPPVKTEFCPYIKWNICKNILPFPYTLYHYYYVISTNALWWRNFAAVFALFPNIIFTITFVAGFTNFLAIVRHIPMFLWGAHPLWCRCSCGFSITFSNNFVSFVLRNTYIVCTCSGKNFIVLLRSHCTLLENNTEAFIASCCYWKTFLWQMPPWRSRGKHITNPIQSNFQIFQVILPICDLETYIFVSLIITVIFSLLLVHTVSPPFICHSTPFICPWTCSSHLRCYPELWYLLFLSLPLLSHWSISVN